jgi:hypothetical protein
VNVAAHLARRPSAKPARKPAPCGRHGHERAIATRNPTPAHSGLLSQPATPLTGRRPPPKVVYARLYGLDRIGAFGPVGPRLEEPWRWMRPAR